MSSRDHSRGSSLALSIAAAIGGLAVPPLPLVRRHAWTLALGATILWLVALYVFFVHFAGPGALAHLGLWFLAVLGMCTPRCLARFEAWVRRTARTEPG